jgi:hypothetical protein
VANPLQEQLAEILLERIGSEPEPSGTYMDMFESIASPQLRLQYALLLIQRLENDPHPSMTLLQRAQRVTAEFGS